MRRKNKSFFPKHKLGPSPLVYVRSWLLQHIWVCSSQSYPCINMVLRTLKIIKNKSLCAKLENTGPVLEKLQDILPILSSIHGNF